MDALRTRMDSPSIGFHPIYTKKDQIRWRAIYAFLCKKGLPKAKAEADAFLEVWKMRDIALRYR